MIRLEGVHKLFQGPSLSKDDNHSCYNQVNLSGMRSTRVWEIDSYSHHKSTRIRLRRGVHFRFAMKPFDRPAFVLDAL